MKQIQVLDCTLRDGGYCNKWKFGFDNIKKVASKLVEANIDIIECGFLTERIEYNIDTSKFTSLEQITTVLPTEQRGKLFVAMMNFGEYDIEKLPFCDGTSIEGIRVAFHKKDFREAIKVCEKIKLKGYKVFIQAMLSLNYSDTEFLELLEFANRIEPYAFYIVDSFGMMKYKDLVRLFYMVEHNLKDGICIGFHSHNNLQLAYSNAQSLAMLQTNRSLIIDVSVYGMGRGAGNLNTELFVEYLNENVGKRYDVKPLLSIIDEILNEFFQRSYWGYSLPNYLSATHNAHPNYAGYLDDKKTLTVEAMNDIFSMMAESKKAEYDKSYIEELYLRYMEREQVQNDRCSELKEVLDRKSVLLIAPGTSSENYKDRIAEFASSRDIVVISINFDYQYLDVDYIFISNLRRFRQLEKDKNSKCIVTSNIVADGVYLQIDYSELINDEDKVKDNAGMMAIKFLTKFNVDTIFLAGFDGYSHSVTDNYANEELSITAKNSVLDAMNIGMENVIKEYRDMINIEFLTPAKHIKIL